MQVDYMVVMACMYFVPCHIIAVASGFTAGTAPVGTSKA